MDDVLCLQAVAFRDLCLASPAAVQGAAFDQQSRPCRTMDSTIHTATAQQTAIGRVHNAIAVQLCDVTLFECNFGFKLFFHIAASHLFLFTEYHISY